MGNKEGRHMRKRKSILKELKNCDNHSQHIILVEIMLDIRQLLAFGITHNQEIYNSSKFKEIANEESK